METQQTDNNYAKGDSVENKKWSGRNMAGIVIVGLGTILLANKLGAELPNWIHSWEMFLIAIGVFVGFRSSFKNPALMIPLAICSFLLLDHYFLDFSIHEYIWPMVVIIIGLVMIFKPKKNKGWNNWENVHHTSSSSD